MSIHRDKQRYLKDWYASYPGSLLSHEENSLLKDILPPLCGYYLLHLGELDNCYTFNKSAVLQTVHLQPHFAVTDKLQVTADYHQLPFASASVDSVFLPHIAEYAPAIEDILDEAVRVLVPDGYLILLGFNPVSLLGLWEFAKRLFNPKKSRLGHFYSRSKMQRFLNELDAEVIAVKTCFFRLPLTNVIWLERLRFLEILGRSCWPNWGASYVMVAQKRVIPLTAIHTAWQVPITNVDSQVITPTTRSFNCDQAD